MKCASIDWLFVAKAHNHNSFDCTATFLRPNIVIIRKVLGCALCNRFTAVTQTILSQCSSVLTLNLVLHAH